METEAIKKVCRDLLAKLKTEKLVLAWRTKRTMRAAVRLEIEKMLDSGQPENYTTVLFKQKGGGSSSMCWRSIRRAGLQSIRMLG